MSKVLVNSDRLDLLVEVAELSGKCILKDGSIKECIYTPCNCCVFYDLNCQFGFDGYKGIIDWLKGD